MNKQKSSPSTQPYKDGVIAVYRSEYKGGRGAEPECVLHYKYKLRFDERTVGISRFYSAKQHDIKIDRVLRTPKLYDVSVQDIVLFQSRDSTPLMYEVKQVQYPENCPRSMDLSLERIEQKFSIAMKEGEDDS